MSSVIARPEVGSQSTTPAAGRPRSTSSLAPVGAWLRVHAADVVVSLVLLAWLVPLTHRFGGRDPGTLSIGLALLAVAAVVTRAWVIPPRHLIALLPGTAALVAVGLSPRRGDGLDEAALWLSGGLVYLVVAAWLRRGGRSGWVGAVVLIALLDQFFAAWWPWFGEGDATSLMRGTFFWHNQFAAFMLGTGLLAAVVVVLGAGRLRILATVGFIAAVAGTYYSTSRASLAILAVGCVMAAVLGRHRLAGVARLGLASLGAAAFTWVLSSPLLMPRGDIVSGYVFRTNNVAENGMTRLEYWKAALTLLRERPVTGTGADSFGTAGSAVVGTAAMPSTLVHNGFLQTFVDGGLVLGGSVVLCAAIVLVIATRHLLSVLRRGTPPSQAWRAGAALGVGALLVHAAVDFDWTYPSLVVLACVLAALAVANGPHDRLGTDPAVARPRVAGSTAAVAIALTCAFTVGLTASAGSDSAAPTGPVAGWRTVLSLGVAAPDGSLRVPAAIRPVSACLNELREWTISDQTGPPPTALMQCTEQAAVNDPWVATARASAVAHGGDLSAADALVRPALLAATPTNGKYALVPVQLALLAGRPDLAAARVPAAQRAMAATAGTAEVLELRALRLQIARELPMSTAKAVGRGTVGLDTARGSAPVVTTDAEGDR